MQSILSFPIGDDVLASLEKFEGLIQQYETTTKKTLDDVTKMGVVMSQLNNSTSSERKKLGEHLVFNSYRLETYSDMRRELHEVLLPRRFLQATTDGVAIDAFSKGKKGGKGKGKGHDADAGSFAI